MGSLALAACGGAGSESEELFDDGVGGHGSSGALTPDADSGAEDGAAGEDGAAPMVCAPGKVEACPCPGGGQGAQACRDDGSGFEPCECSVGDGGSGGSGGAPADAGTDAPPDLQWWCTGDDASCVCKYAASGSRTFDACPQSGTCCWQTKATDGTPKKCECDDTPRDGSCSALAGLRGAVVTKGCPAE